MPDGGPCIPEELMQARLAQSEQLREFFIQMWRQNPQLAARAGQTVRAILSPGRTAVPPAPTFDSGSIPAE